jgi:hypothetical protein
MLSVFDSGTYVQRLWAIAIGLIVVVVVTICGFVYRKHLEANYTPVRGTVLEVATRCLLREDKINYVVFRQTRETDIPCDEARAIDKARSSRRSAYLIRYGTHLSYSYVSPVGREIFTGTATTTDSRNTFLRRGETIMVWAHNTVPNRSEYAGSASYQ